MEPDRILIADWWPEWQADSPKIYQELGLKRLGHFKCSNTFCYLPMNMQENIEILKHIIGREILDIQTEVSFTYPIKTTKDTEQDMLVETPLVITFDEYRLFVYNKWRLVLETGRNMQKLKGLKFIDIQFQNLILLFKINAHDYLQVDLTDDGYLGPEALVLHGPKGCILVWN